MEISCWLLLCCLSLILPPADAVAAVVAAADAPLALLHSFNCKANCVCRLRRSQTIAVPTRNTYPHPQCDVERENGQK